MYAGTGAFTCSEVAYESSLAPVLSELFLDQLDKRLKDTFALSNVFKIFRFVDFF